MEDSYVWRYVRKVYFSKLLPKIKLKFVSDYLFENVKDHFISIKNEANKLNPKLKMIILVYPDNYIWNFYLNSSNWEKMQERDFIILRVEDILDDCGNPKYQIKDDGHPSELAWTEIVKYIMENHIVE